MSQPPAILHSHSFRTSVLDQETTWILFPDRLRIEGSFVQEWSLASILSIRLCYAPGRSRPNLFRCQILTHQGQLPHLLNEHYQGFAQFEDRSASYRDFVLALIQRTAHANPACKFLTGLSTTSYLLQLLMLAIIGFILLLVLFFAWSAIGALVIVKLLILACLMPAFVRWVKWNKPSTFSPDAPPADLLPAGD